jgi:aerobic-type carbon monoxide dehydrogenase small subunit (CoxS/CutS family)
MSESAGKSFLWNGRAVRFQPGETVAAALRRAGVTAFGSAAGGQQGRYFCGIGACQGCLVSPAEGMPFEACLTLARPGMVLGPVLPAEGPGA